MKYKFRNTNAENIITEINIIDKQIELIAKEKKYCTHKFRLFINKIALLNKSGDLELDGLVAS